MGFALEFTEDPRVFLGRAGVFLGADPVLNTVIATATAAAVQAADAGQPAPEWPRWWLTMTDQATAAPVGVAMRTAPFPPYPLYVLPMPDAAARDLAAALVERGEEVSGLNGALPATEVLATELARRTGRRARVHEHMRLHVLERLVEPDEVPDGRARVALPADSELVLAWFRAFHADAAAQAGRLEPEGEGEQFDDAVISSRIAEGRVFVWEDGLGTPVSLVGFNAPSFGVARVGPVYTPGAHRGHGFASALTAHVSRLLRDAGSQVCLFTDQANPTSNKIYAALGYVPVVDMANLRITTPARV
ncbi:MAG TPA: GNAT family N-acetyltransferase [Nocardioides bacterium]|uniref:GNAT family N-acetyltransferase n=1 Tax=uncultured Nocardioides sp. TaxID=198441 RepID=UPI000EEB1F76|nr:GNAT family N-acetyltransferase [uncultured Nocardioides sp.]HCB07502.1 GNAT family N-acetyltransferase [Nocardioides sp.]